MSQPTSISFTTLLKMIFDGHGAFKAFYDQHWLPALRAVRENLEAEYKTLNELAGFIHKNRLQDWNDKDRKRMEIAASILEKLMADHQGLKAQACRNAAKYLRDAVSASRENTRSENANSSCSIFDSNSEGTIRTVRIVDASRYIQWLQHDQTNTNKAPVLCLGEVKHGQTTSGKGNELWIEPGMYLGCRPTEKQRQPDQQPLYVAEFEWKDHSYMVYDHGGITKIAAVIIDPEVGSNISRLHAKIITAKKLWWACRAEEASGNEPVKGHRPSPNGRWPFDSQRWRRLPQQTTDEFIPLEQGGFLGIGRAQFGVLTSSC